MEHNVIYIGNDRCKLYVGSSRRCVVTESALPYDAEIEYLEATGTQYIDTLFYPRTTNPDIKAEVKFNKSVLAGDHCVLGARNGTGGNAGYKLPNFYNDILEYQGIIPSGRANLTGYNINTDYISIAEIKRGEQKIYINGVLQTETTYDSNCDSHGTLYLFAIRQNNKWYFNGKIYYCKIWQDNVLVRDFIPVRVGQVGYMYDKVSGQLFGNVGTGSFILGNDKT